MFALLILCFAATSAAPYYGMGYNPTPFYPDHHFDRFSYPQLGEDLFDTRRFWSELSTELRGLDNILADFYRRFPISSASSQGIDGKEYKVTIPLSGFEEKDIAVKARKGVLMIQAVHKHGGIGQNSYLDVRTLPDCVDVKGSWTYSQGVLKIVFPVKEEATTESAVVHEVSETTEDVITQSPNIESREEIDNKVESETQDADVGLQRKDTDKERQLSSNEIMRNNFEATTYAVDLKDEIEFVPVRY